MVGRVQAGTVVADGELMATGERWVFDSLITDEQRRRLAVYQEFFGRKEERLPPFKSLLGWTDVWPAVQSSAEELTVAGGALVSIPVRLLRPQANTPLLIPAGMLRLIKDPMDTGQAPAYDEPSGQWANEMSLGSRLGLQLVLPPEVLPFQAEGIELYLSVRAPSRVVRIIAGIPGEAGVLEEIELARLDSPSMPWQGQVTDPRILASVADGTLDVILEISRRTDIEFEENATSFVAWRIDALRGSMRGSRLSTEVGE